MKTAEEIKEARSEAWKQSHEKFIVSTLEKYSEIFEKDLTNNSRTIIDLRKTTDTSDYQFDWANVLHCIAAGQLNIHELGHMFVAEFRKLGYKARFDGSDAIIVEMP